MLLAIDMGNTQTAMGLFDGDELVQSWRMPTDRSYTADEIHVRLMGFFKMYGLSLDAVGSLTKPRRGGQRMAVRPRRPVVAVDLLRRRPQRTGSHRRIALMAGIA